MDNKKDLIDKISQKYYLELLLLFGSQVSGKISKESDFDVAYLSGQDLGLTDEANLIVEIAPIFKSENIDLVNLKKASPLLLYAITRNCQVLFEKNPLNFASLRAYAFKKYIETKPLYEQKFKRSREIIKNL